MSVCLLDYYIVVKPGSRRRDFNILVVLSCLVLVCFEFSVSMHVSQLLYSNKEERKTSPSLPNQTLQTPSNLMSYPVMLPQSTEYTYSNKKKKKRKEKNNNSSSHPRIIPTKCKSGVRFFCNEQKEKKKKKKKKNLRLQLTFNQAQVSTLNR